MAWTLLPLWISAIPLVFLLVALTVLFQRLRDRNAWVMALVFCGFMSLFAPQAAGGSPVLPGFMMAYRMTLLMMAPGLFAFFFLVFPARSRLDERAPGLKWLLVGFGAFLVLTAGPWRPLLGQPVSNNLAGETILPDSLALWRTYGVFGNVFLGIAVGILALVGHAVGVASPEVRRKARVLAWGTVAGIAPALSVAVAEVAGAVPDWLAAVALLALPLMPLAFAYAVVRHRVMAVPVLVQRGARYLLVQRGLAVASVASSLVVAVVLAMLAQRWLPAGSDLGLPVAVVAAGLLGVGVARAGARVERRITDRIDRAFFPERYEARRALEELADRTRTAEDRPALASLLEAMLRSAFRPVSLAVYLEDRDGWLAAADLPEGPGVLARDAGALAALASRARPAVLPPPGIDDAADELHRLLAPLRPECLERLGHPVAADHEGVAGLEHRRRRLAEPVVEEADHGPGGVQRLDGAAGAGEHRRVRRRPLPRRRRRPPRPPRPRAAGHRSDRGAAVRRRGAERRPDAARGPRHAAGCAGRRCESDRSIADSGSVVPGGDRSRADPGSAATKAEPTRPGASRGLRSARRRASPPRTLRSSKTRGGRRARRLLAHRAVRVARAGEQVPLAPSVRRRLAEAGEHVGYSWGEPQEGGGRR